MKLVKSLLLGSAAGLIAVGGAQAADLPVKAKAVEYVKICSLYGAGFYYIPGTDTCIKFGGYLRADMLFNTNSDYGIGQGAPGGANNRLDNYYQTRARLDFTIDTRTATEYGVVRTYADTVFSWDATSVTGSAPSAFSVGSASLGLYHAFIQFAGFTFGRTVSIFDAPWQSYPAGGPDFLPGGSNNVTGVNQVAYTADFGQGITGSVALQDMTTAAGGQSNLWNASVTGVAGAVGGFATTAAAGAAFIQGIYGVNDWGGTRMPDIVGQVRVDQAWGLFQISAAAHELHSAYYGTTEPTGHPSDKWGWAVQGALSIKNIPTGAGDSINLQAVYTDGASRYNFQSLFPQTIFIYGGSGIAYQSVGFAGIADGVFGSGTGIETVKTWGFRGGYTHNWSPNWSSGIYGAYASLRYGDASKALICANFAAALAPVAGSTCNPDFNLAVVGGNLVWTPVKGLAFTADVSYVWLDQKHSGVVTGANTANLAVAKPAATYELKDQGNLQMLLRAQRNF
ncbi:MULTISPECIES: porin [unclassified Bradyrhizobium]|uniref:porin n=1 Tax=unclassified Bradyrhizobium TaxID=2631580 RepID=UPI002302BF67|nr:porin [Bradyrhizobium sp. CCBAU 45321]MDA9543660.1 polymerase [Bradyrhizobium sp. CCBAU 45321]